MERSSLGAAWVRGFRTPVRTGLAATAAAFALGSITLGFVAGFLGAILDLLVLGLGAFKEGAQALPLVQGRPLEVAAVVP